MIRITIVIFVLLSGFTTISVSGQDVDVLSGRFQFSIPVATLRANDVSIPISLYHHGGSQQVAEGQDQCGLGWGLAAGGAVSRIVRGLPDEINLADRKGWLHNNNALAVQNLNLTANDNLTDCTDEQVDFNALESLVGSMVNDTEPDVFFIRAPGLSAEFVFGTDGLPKLLTHQDISIVFSGGNFTVKTTNGFTYNFNSQELAGKSTQQGCNLQDINTECRYYTSNVNYVSQWKLSSITSVVTGTVANFHYAGNGDEIKSRRYLTIDSTRHIETRISMPLRISSITLKSFTANFSWSNNLLSKVTVTESGTADKIECQLVYSSVSDQPVYPFLPINKSVLTGVLLSNNSPFSMYRLEYASMPTVAWRKNWQMDFFGYFNAVSSNKNDPTLYFYTNESDGRRLRVTPIPGGSPVIETGSDRTVNVLENQAGALQKIIMPGGGFVSVTYESNTYWDATTNQELNGAGVRVKKLVMQGGEVAFGKSIDNVNPYRSIVKEYEYKLADNKSSGVLLAPVKLGYILASGIKKSAYNLGDEPDVMYTRVTEKITGQGKRIYEYNIPGVFPETTNGDWKATKSRIARKLSTPCIVVGSIKNGFYTFPFAPSTNYNHKRGFLNRVSEYSETGVLIRERLMTYTELTSNPLLIKGLKFEKIGEIYHYGIYEMLTGRVQVISQEIVKEASEESPSLWLQTTTDYTYNNNMVREVKTTMPDNSIVTKRIKYAKDFQFTNPSTDTMAVALKKLNDQFRHTAVVEEINKVKLPGLTETLGSTLLIYRNFSGDRVLPYYIRSLPVGAALTEAYVSSQNFVADTDYRQIKTFKEYDSESRLLTEVDFRKNRVGYHYTLNTSAQVAVLANAAAQQAIYEGLETTTSFGLTPSGTGITYPAGWTGKKGIQFTNGTAMLVSSSLPSNMVQKGGNIYRASCWIYAQNDRKVIFTVKQGASSITVELFNTQTNVWTYLEKDINISSITGPFTLEVKTNASGSLPVILDDIVFIPRDARISFQTLMPLTGITSTTDDRGFSNVMAYDEAKRPDYVMDRNRNVVSKSEYSTKVNPPPCVLTAQFTKSPAAITLNTPITFGANQSCGTNLTFKWEVDGIVQTSTSSTMIFTFATPGAHNVKLTVADGQFGTETFTETICVGVQLSMQVHDLFGNIVNPETQSFDCNSYNIPLTYTVNGLGSFASQVEILWYTRVYDPIRNEYQLVKITTQGGAPIEGLDAQGNVNKGVVALTTFYSTTTTYVARVRYVSQSNQFGCLPYTQDTFVTITYLNNSNCN